ncbi:hypothetical protein Cob_v002436 [Colletotrichum orbiculare MAFF 240422]|uniref:Uncharacterized protein n=1 Tax=Colletotrichum orbiculare (strain 104-T / ATCC 96160 / CBS 514.97 / LARS 414 / MAFF 240422) TaxID=1213857 RepID=N4VM16_COLOR|nr:hypothetical protein Cob_v002436 [Colletotrichum orbiculare MAFF 240422]
MPPRKTALKRKRDANEDANDAKFMDGILKQRTDAASKAAGHEWARQYYQGVPIGKLSGMGCGLHILGSPEVPFQSPFPCDGRFEISSGTGPKGSGGGSIRLIGPKNYWGDSEEGILDAILLVPFRHVEQVIVIPNPSRVAEEDWAYRVIVVPTAATGASSIVREYPQLVSFSWPDNIADKGLAGQVGAAADDKKDTYLSVLKRAFDAHLGAFHEKVIDVSDQTRSRLIGVPSNLSVDSPVQVRVQGHAFFLKTGILFTSESRLVYLPVESIQKAMIVQAHDAKSKNKNDIAGVDVICDVTEPYYKGREGETAQKALISLGHLEVGILGHLKEYMKAHNIGVMMCQQHFYDYERNVPATGWMPIMG